MVNLKQLFAIGLLFFAASAASAQLNLTVLQNEKIIGRNFKTNKDINATEYIFPEKIYYSSFDTSSNLIILQLCGSMKTNFLTRSNWETSINGITLNLKGSIAVFDLSNKQMRWDTNVAFIPGYVIQEAGMLIINKYSSFGWVYEPCHRLNIKTGADQWESKTFIRYIRDCLNFI
jgi:hypothetical protein